MESRSNSFTVSNILNSQFNTNSIKSRLFNPDDVMAYLFGHITVDTRRIPLSSSSVSNKLRISQLLKQRDSGYNSNSNNYSVNSGPKENKNLLPEYIEIEQYDVGQLRHTCVSTKKCIGGSNIIGMFEGTKVQQSEIKTKLRNREYSWRVYKDNKITYVIDAEKEDKNWLKYISKSRNSFEQNIDVVYDWENDKLLFIANRNILIGEELLAWYKKSDWISYITSYPITCYLPKPIERPQLSPPKSGGCAASINIENQHERENPGEYFCEKCGGDFTYKYYLERHRKFTKCIDGPSRKFPCTQCTRTFEKAERLRVHVRQVHDKIKPYKCSTCTKEFSQSSSLTKHLRIHNGSRPYQCLVCEKVFTASSILTTHMRQHTGEKPFKCTICKKGFASHAAHHSHVRRSHKIEPQEMKKMSLEANLLQASISTKLDPLESSAEYL